VNAALYAIFRALQLACPPEFRREYGAAMRLDFAQGLRDELHVHGALAALTFAFGAYADLLFTALREIGAMIFRDFTFALRTLRHAPVFAGIVILTLALAIGANATVFSIVRAVVLAPLPYPDSGRLVALLGTKDAAPFSLSLPDFHDLTARSTGFSAVSAFAPRTGTLTGRGEPVWLAGFSATPGLFETLGVRPVLGRTFTLADAHPGAAPAVVISETLWRNAFHSDPRALGATLVLDAKAYRVIGIMPASLRQPDFDGRELEDESFWVPIDPNSTAREYGRGAHYFQAVGRLRPGASLASVRAELAARFARLAAEYPAEDKHFGVDVEPAYDRIVGDVRPLLIAIFAAVAGVLLVACANVANLLLSRAASRDREFAIRSAVGATRGRLVAQLLVETFLFAALGGLLGSGLAAIAVRAFVAAHPAGLPRVDEVRFDAPAASYTAAAVVLCTLIAGIAPALSLSRRGVAEALHWAGRAGDASRGARARGILVVAEVALTLALVVSSGLVLRSFVTLTSQPLGFDPSGVTIASVQVPSDATSDALVRSFLTRVADRVRALPGVDSASWCYSAPFTRRTFDLSFRFADRPAAAGQEPSSQIDVVDEHYFATLGQRVLRGRTLARGDMNAWRAAVVNEAFAREFNGGRAAIGAGLLLGMSDDAGRPVTTVIVGVVADARPSYSVAAVPTIYLPLGSVQTPYVLLLVRSHAGAANASALAAAFTSADSFVARPRVKPYADYLADDTAQTRLAAVSLGSLAFIALVLSLAGIYAVVSYGVAQRTHEFGIRMALGARAWSVIRSAVAGAMRLVAAGVACGLVVSACTTHLLAGQLYGVAPLDPLTFATVSFSLALAAFAAALVPAGRATRVDPVVALRYE
jgi:putative ABC transport system permease protein